MAIGVPHRWPSASSRFRGGVCCIFAARLLGRSVPNKGDVAWMIVATALVIMMSVPALALFYGGLVRSKNMLSVLMQVFVVFSMIVVLWCLYGYSLAFSEGNAVHRAASTGCS